jgi:hypothetical protein
MTSAYYAESVRLGREFQENNKSWAGYDVVKYQNCIKDRSHYPGWLDDQLNTTWNDIPNYWTDKYQYVEAIYR